MQNNIFLAGLLWSETSLMYAQDETQKKSIMIFNIKPRYCVIVGWMLCLSTMAISILFLVSFGIMFGNDLTYQWLTSLLISFFGGILVIEPLKVRLSPLDC